MVSSSKSFGQLVAAVALLLLAACSDSKSEDGAADTDETVDAVTTTAANDSGASDAETPTSTTTDAEPTVEINLADSVWVVNGFDGLVDDGGEQLASLDGLPVTGGRTAARAVDGTLYFTTEERLWRLAADDPDLVELDLDGAEVWDLGYGDAGQVVTSPYSDSPVTVDDQSGRQFQFEVDDGGSTQSITAANGVTVRVIDPTGEYDAEGGYLSKVETLAKLEVVGTSGQVEWTVEAGGSSAAWLNLIDFNGRHVMMARAPSEPADPVLQHIVYDLDCPHDGPIPTSGQPACTRTFWAPFGKATLVGPDRLPGDDDLNPQLLDICPTALTDIQPPLEMTEDWFGRSMFTETDRRAFEDLALALTTCDPLGVLLTGDHTIAHVDEASFGLRYEAGPDQVGGDKSGWMWTEVAKALDGPFELLSSPEAGVVWQRRDDGAVIRLEQPDGYMMIERPAEQPPGEVAVVRGDSHIVVTGSTGQATVPVILASVNDVADQYELEVVDLLVGSGPEHPDDVVTDFASSVRRDLAEPGREVHLSGDDVVISPAADELVDAQPDLEAIAFALSDFAGGGDGAFGELRLANRVGLALGPELAAWRDRDDLAEPSSWTINNSDFRAYSGPFDILAEAGGPVVVGYGVHGRCSSPVPSPAPAELAQLRRVSLQPPEDSIDSCLQWSSVDLFIDDQGQIRGVSLDLWEP